MGKFGPSITHSLFADDIVLFGIGDASTINVVKSILDSFCNLSGQSISLYKLRFCVSKNMDARTSSFIQRTLGIELS